jgi:hypothetical protein
MFSQISTVFEGLDMYNSSDWREYFFARHNTFLVLGIVAEALALMSTLTGTALAKYEGIVSRAEDPKKFQDIVFFYYLVGFFLLILYVCTFR